MSRAEGALMRLYENADLRDELTDDEAETLLKWAETQLTLLDTPALDDEAYEAQVDTLMRLIKQMNRYAGRQGQGFAAQSLSAQGVDETPTKIAALAAALGRETDAEQIAAAGTGEPGSTVAALTAILSPAADEPPQIQPPTAANTEIRETNTDDDSTVEAQAAAWVRDRAAAFDRWLRPDADADPTTANPNRDGNPPDGHADTDRDAS